MKRGPIRESVPIPSLTCSTFAPTASQIDATALIKEIFIARNALEACLISSALFELVTIRRGGALPMAASGRGIASPRPQYHPLVRGPFSRFEGWFAGIEKRALKLGDYSIAGLEDDCVVERKDLADLFPLTTERSVFVNRATHEPSSASAACDHGILGRSEISLHLVRAAVRITSHSRLLPLSPGCRFPSCAVKTTN